MLAARHLVLEDDVLYLIASGSISDTTPKHKLRL